jgi:hypothetical protein
MRYKISDIQPPRLDQSIMRYKQPWSLARNPRMKVGLTDSARSHTDYYYDWAKHEIFYGGITL